MGASTSLVEPILKTWGDIAITVVLMASPATYTGERNADLANDIVEPEPVVVHKEYTIVRVKRINHSDTP